MTDQSSNTADRNRHFFAWLLFPLALFPLAALLTYDWRAMSQLNTPPLPHSNWIGALGDNFAYYGYQLFGLAIWIVPVLCVIAGLCVTRGRRMRLGRRELWFTVFLSATACVLQVIGNHGGPIADLAARVNTTNAGGAVGYLVMTRALSPLLNDFGACIVMVLVMICTLVAAIGLENLRAAGLAVLQWACARSPRPVLPAEASKPESGFDPNPAPATDPYQAILDAREAARREREAEKERIRQEKIAAKEAKIAEKIAAKEAKEAAKIAEREAKIAEREAKLAEKEAAKEAAWAAARAEAGLLPPPEEEAEEAVAPAPQPPAPQVPAPQRHAQQVQVQAPQAPAAPPPVAEPEDKGPYLLPTLSLLNPLKSSTADHGDVDEMTHKLIDTLKLFGVDATLAYTVQGPVVTKYALFLAPGTRYSTVTNISDNLMGALHAKSLRIEAPIPGEECVGIEVPNRAPAGITFREIFESDAWRNAKAELPLLFGKRADGKELVADLASMPHMLVAGATGQGKSVCLNSLICGLLMSRTPEQLKLIMVDPKCVEFTPYSSIPHLLVPVITDNKKVVFSLHWAVAEMEKRLKLFARARVRNIYDFNHRPQVTQTDMFGDNNTVGSDMPRTVPYIVIIIDEAADLIGQCGKEVNPDIQRITQKARAAGIHLILATQRPDAKIITGSIKANIPGRVAFKTSSSVDSRTILDDTGAENLIGKGDMLFKGKDGLLIRAQGAWISDDEIARITQFIEEHSNTAFDDRFAKKLSTIKEAEVDIFADDSSDKDDETAKSEAAAAREQVKAEENASDFKKAVECIINTNRASTSHFQRKLGWGYNHSAKIMDMLEDAGIIGPQSGAGPRTIIMDQDQLLAVFNGNPAGDSTVPSEGVAPAAPDDDAATDTFMEENT